MGAGYVDDVLVMMVQGGTQWDALCHVYYDGQLWNGFPATTVDARGAARGGIDKVHGDFVSRGVLLDVARAQGVDCLRARLRRSRPRTSRRRKRGRACASARATSCWSAPVRCRPSATSRTGRASAARRPDCTGRPPRGCTTAASRPSRPTTRWSRPARQIPGVWVPFHMLALCNLGLHLGEFWYLEALARDCAADGVWECLLVAQALPIAGGSGSPVNPMAMK